MKTLLMVLAAMEALSGKGKGASQAGTQDSAGTPGKPTGPEVDRAVQCERSDAGAADKEAPR